jgi:3-isopropylmalate dehydratase small subunit
MVVFKLAPAEFLIGMKNILDAGKCCLMHTHPKFRDRAHQGFNIVVGGKGFGCGSSREQAVMALLGKSSRTILLKRIRVPF